MRAPAAGACLRGLLTVALVACLASVVAGCAQAAGHRVVVPEVGIAASLPDDWTAVTVLEDPDLSFLTALAPERLGPDVEVRNVLVAHEPERPGREMPLGCTLMSYRPLALTPAQFMDELYGQSADWPVEALHDGLNRVRAGPFTGERFFEQYAIAGDDAIAFLWCSGETPLESDWLSIAESVEFLPSEE
jgi:hypothetical protein